MIFDKITMSAFVGTPLDLVLRDCGIDTVAIAGAAMEVGIEPTVRHAADLGYLPIVVTDACGAGDPDAAQRSLAGIAFAGDALLTDTETIRPLLAAGAATRPEERREPDRAGDDRARGREQESEGGCEAGADLDQPVRVLAGVVPAELELATLGQCDPYQGRRAAAVATVEPGQWGNKGAGGHDFTPPRVGPHQLR